MTTSILGILDSYDEMLDIEDMGVRSWMENYIFFGADEPRPGPFVPDDWQCDIIDSFTTCRETDLIQFSQSGKSTKLGGLLGWLVDTRKRAVVSFPTEKLRDRFLEDKVQVMIDHSPRFASQIILGKDGKIQNGPTIKSRYGPSIKLSTGGETGGLQQMTAEYVLIDELDKFSTTVESSDPAEVLRGRTRAYRGRGHLIIASTPTTTERSYIWARYKRSSMYRRYYDCPLCEGPTKLDFVLDEPKVIRCTECKEPLPFDAQYEILATGRWIAENPAMVGIHNGFQYGQLNSADIGWEELLMEFNPDKPRDFVAQQMALPVAEAVVEPLDDDELAQVLTEVPDDWQQIAKVMTVDVQRRHDGELVYGVWDVYNSVAMPSLACTRQIVIPRHDGEWRTAFRELRRHYLNVSPDVMFIDAGDAHGCDVPEMVRQIFPQELRSGKVRPIMGRGVSRSSDWGNHPMVANDETIRTIKKKLDRPLQVNSPSAKARVFDLVRQIRLIFPGRIGVDYPSNLLSQLGSEYLRSYISAGGYENRKWTKAPGRENETLDLGTYAVCAIAYLGPRYASRRQYGPMRDFVP